jgi:DNA invertase Pin-like site-specific DNA recombinase
MKVGYARTSTRKQEAGLAAQLRTLLEQNGCEEIFQEQVSGAEQRAQLNAAIRCLRPGDQLVVTKLDRFARSLEHAIKLERCIGVKGASLVILDPAVDTSTSIGRLMFNMIGAIAQFEREIMLDRQRDGIAVAQAAGKYVGRQPTARRKTGEVMALKAEGVANIEIARRLGIGIASVYRILRGGGGE